jgi:hypothetical protein
MSGWQWFWYVLVCAAVVWYATVTIYVAIRGAADIRSMLRRLGEGEDLDEHSAESESVATTVAAEREAEG